MAETAKTEMIQALVDSRLKAEAEAVLDELGLTASDAIGLFYEQVVMIKGLPFDVEIPNAETRQALRVADAGGDLLGPFDDTEEMFRKLGV